MLHPELDHVVTTCRDISFNLDTIVDMSKGCDQFVYLTECIEHGKVVIKIPKEEKDKVEKQLIMSLKASLHGVNSSSVVHHTNDFLVETYIPGESITLEKHGDSRSVWYKLGQQMRLLHSIPGASGYSNRVLGETCEKFPIFSTYSEKMGGDCGLVWDDVHRKTEIDQYLKSMLAKAASRGCHQPPVFLHYDIAFDNIIVDSRGDDTTVSLIDFADAGMGDPMEDFAFLCCFLYDTPQFEHIIAGYGGLTLEDRMWIEFYCVVWLTWALSGEDKPERRAHQLTVVDAIVNKGLLDMSA